MGDPGGEEALLLERARAGDDDAFEQLYLDHLDAALRLARILVGADHADELVSESFARVLARIRAGHGPTEDFRAYLQVTIRNGYRDTLRAAREDPASDRPWLLDDTEPPVEDLVEDLDRSVAVDALATLPDSWQQVLWHLEVEGRKPAEVATLLEMQPAAVSSLAYRAREGLRRAYLDQHLQPSAAGGDCHWAQTRMAQYVRGDLSVRAQRRVSAHLDECGACLEAYFTVDRVNQKLAAYLFPIVLWGATGADRGSALFLWLSGAGAGASVGSPVSGGAVPVAGPSEAGGAAAAGGGAGGSAGLAAAVAVVAAAVVGGFVFAVTTAGGDDPPEAAAPGGTTSDAARPDDPARRPEPGPARRSRTPVAPPAADPPAPPAPEPTRVPRSEPSQPSEPSGPSDPEETEQPEETEDPPPTEDPAPTTVRLADARVSPSGLPVLGPWAVAAVTEVDGEEPVVLEVVYRFEDGVLASKGGGEGWDCRVGIVGLLPSVHLGPRTPLTCAFEYDGTQPPVVRLHAYAVDLDLDLNTRPLDGTITLKADGEVVRTAAFG
ncbi:MAG TPA: sigma-70 family RNA polymerase sigma factor [Nocardioides sp.]|nr:sigma-70 family RNA polymerase sigma factor [Nocardioides sp.]